MMKTWPMFSAALVCSLLIAPRASACDTAATATADSTCVVLARDGYRGVWFDLATANALRIDHDKVPPLEKLAADTKAALDLRSAQSGQLSAAYAAEQTAQVAAMKAYEKAQAEADAAHAWYRSPLLWFGVGAVLGAGAVTVLALETR